MTYSHTAPEWLKPGAEVAIIFPARMGLDSAHVGTILRIGKRDVVVKEDGGPERRFRIADLTLQGPRDAWKTQPYLVARGDPKHLEIEQAQRDRAAASKVEVLVQNWRRTGDETQAREAFQLLKHHLGE